jgi:predicted TPR repeat methyltransferase
MGVNLKPHADTLIGVDFSPAMVAKARERSVYDELALGDLSAFLAERGVGEADLIVAADVLPYLGDLAPLLQAVARVLSASGLFAFTAEACDGEAYRLNAGLRFAHSRAYLEQCASAAGLQISLLEPEAARQEKGQDAPGWIGVIQQPGLDAGRTLEVGVTEDRSEKLNAA